MAMRLQSAVSASFLCLAATLAGAPPALAQLAEVIVTARKTAESVQDIPISVSAFTSRDIEERGLRDIAELSRSTPGFTLERTNRYGVQGGVSRPVIRGMSNILGEGNASVFVDGILFSDSILSFPFDLVDRVEVIKGPQAALFGRATFAGAINLITKKGTNELESRVNLRAAQFGDYEVNGIARGPLVADKLFFMLHGRYYTFDGMYRNTLDGRKVGGEESYGANASLEYRPGGVFSASLLAGYSKDDDDLAAVVLQDRFSNNCFLNVPRQYYCGEVQEKDSVTLDRAGLQGKEGLRREATRVAATLNFDFDDFSIASSSGAFFTDTEYGYDSTYQGGTAFGLTTIPSAPGAVRAATDPIRRQTTLRNEVSDRTEWSTELRLSSRQDRRYRGMIGLFYYENRRTLQERHFNAATAPTIDFGESRIDNWAAFGSLGADFTDRWTATAELRYAQDKIGNFRRDTGVLIQQSFDTVSPRVTTSFKLKPDVMLYVNVAKGSKPGVINADPRFPPEIRFANEEESWNYEAGVKTTLLEQRLRLNVAAYYIDWKNQQLTTNFTFPTGGTQSYIVNAGKSQVKGAELEMQAALTERLTAGFTWSWVDATFVELNDPEARELFGNSSVKGKFLPQVPQQQASLFGKMEFVAQAGYRPFVRADASYTDRKFDQVFNLANTGAEFLLNLSAGVETDRWNVTLFVNNVTDDRTPSSLTRYVDQMNLNVPQAINPNPALNNVAGSTTQERAFQYPLARKRQVGLTAAFRF